MVRLVRVCPFSSYGPVLVPLAPVLTGHRDRHSGSRSVPLRVLHLENALRGSNGEHALGQGVAQGHGEVRIGAMTWHQGNWSMPDAAAPER